MTEVTTMTLRGTIPTLNPKQTAQAFQFLLAAEKGYTSTLTTMGTSVLLVASDGQAVKFVKATDIGGEDR